MAIEGQMVNSIYLKLFGFDRMWGSKFKKLKNFKKKIEYIKMCYKI